MFVVFIMAITRHRKNTAGVGLVLAYVLSLWMIHWTASVLYILPWYEGPNAATTAAGAEQSLYAVAAFAFGSLAIAPFVIQSGILPRATGLHEIDPRLPKTYMYMGAFLFFLSSTPIGGLPSVSAILSTGQGLIVVGLALCWWQAWRAGDRKMMIVWLMLAFSLPLLTIVTRGFIGSGAAAAVIFLVFVSNFSRSKIRLFALAFVLGYAALSVYVTYMRDRNVIRQSVWGGESLSDRISRLELTATTFEFFDPHNNEHLSRIDDRLNQSGLVGAAVIHLEETRDYAHGETLFDALLALIPRVLWPDKPIEAGSGNLVSRFTGIDFLTGRGQTSVGIGAVMEFYANFGTWGVVIGFLVIGVVVTALDVLATERLANSDLNGFVLFFLPGLAILNVGGQLVEVTAGAAGAVVISLMVNRYLHRYQRQSTQIPGAIVPGTSPALHQRP
jgi:hypothetical protein